MSQTETQEDFEKYFPFIKVFEQVLAENADVPGFAKYLGQKIQDGSLLKELGYDEKPYENGLQALEKEHRQDIKTIERIPRPYCHHCQKEVERYRVEVDEEIGVLGGYRITAKCHGTLDTVALSRWEMINDPCMKRITMFKGGE